MPTKFKFKDGTESILKVNHYEYDKHTLKRKILKRDFATLFVSVATGCGIGCKMCFLTYSDKPVYYLTPDQIVKNNSSIGEFKHKTKISFMGMGEGIFLHKHLYSIANRIAKQDLYGIEVGTMLPFVSDELKDSLNNLPSGRIFFSLHSANQSKRDKIITSKVSLCEAKDFLSDLKIKKVCHYTLIDGLNDSDEDMRLAIKYCQETNAQLRIVEFNKPTKNFILKPSSRRIEVSRLLMNECEDYKFCYSSGKSIKAACGMFF